VYTLEAVNPSPAVAVADGTVPEEVVLGPAVVEAVFPLAENPLPVVGSDPETAAVETAFPAEALPVDGWRSRGLLWLKTP
jgi:hypothetical protein